MPLMSYVPYSRQDLPVYRPKKQRNKNIFRKSVLNRTRFSKQVTTIRRSCSMIVDLYNSSSLGSGFKVGTATSRGVALKFDATGFTMTSLTQSNSSSGMTTSDLSALYDNYRIKGITVRFYTNFNTAIAGTGNSNVLPVLLICNDNVDNLVPTSENNMRENSNMKEVQISQNRYIHKVWPQAINEVLGSTGTAAALANLPRSTWLQTSNMFVPHYGMKLWLNTIGQDLDANVLGSMLITCEYLLELKSVV